MELSSDLLLLGQKLAIGATALVGFGYLLHLATGGPKSHSLRLWIRRRLNDIGLIPIVLLLTTAFVVGIIMDDLSYSYASARAWLFANTQIQRFEEHVSDCLMRPFFESEEELRFEVLYSGTPIPDKSPEFPPDNKISETEEIRPHPLGKELLVSLQKSMPSSGAPDSKQGMDTIGSDPSIRIYLDSLASVNSSLIRPDSKTEINKQSLLYPSPVLRFQGEIPVLNSPYYKAVEATNGLFYNAKNLVFTRENYFHELGVIQERMNFVRSLGVVCSLIFLFYLLFSFLCPLMPGWNLVAFRRLTLSMRYVLFGFACWVYFRIGEQHTIYAARLVLVIGIAAIVVFYELPQLRRVTTQNKPSRNPGVPPKRVHQRFSLSRFSPKQLFEGCYNFLFSPVSDETRSKIFRPTPSNRNGLISDVASRTSMDRIVIWTIVAFLATYFSFRAARFEELAYDSRVFGYYISMVNNPAADNEGKTRAATIETGRTAAR